MGKKVKGKGKKGMSLEFLGWLILGVIVLLIFIGVVIILSDKGNGMIEYLKDLFKIG